MEGFIFSQSGQTIQEILTYVEQQLPGTLEALSKAIGDEATRATNKENELLRAIGGLIPKTEKGSANGVASLNGNGKISTAQAQFAMRGNLVAADIDSTALQSGFYRVIGQRLGEEILGGDEANGVLIQYSDGYKEQQLMVGRAAGASAGEQVEIYTRRYLPTPKRWTAWSKAGGGSGGEDVHILSPREGQVLVYLPEHEEEKVIVPAGWYNRTLSYPSISQYEALVARVAALEQNQ